MYIFNPIYNKKPCGPSKVGEEVEFKLRVNKLINSTKVNFCFSKDFEDIVQKKIMKETDGDEYIEYSVKISFDEPNLYWYYFEVYQGEHVFYLQKTEDYAVEPTGQLFSKFQQFVYKSESLTSKKFQDGVMYHIFVDRFCKVGKVEPRNPLLLRDDWGGNIDKNSNSFKIINKECFGGNLKGIISKLNYLKELNVNTIYLSPIFEANSYHKYDTADYMKIDSMFGDESDFQKLVKTAKERDINVILDGVFNHTGDDSKYFNKYNRFDSLGAFQSEDSKYFEWYSFQNYPKEYSSWWGISSLPEINNESESFTNFIAGKNGVLEKYLKQGIFGFRLDVVDEIDEKRLLTICKKIKSINKNGIVIGEVWEDASNKMAYDKRRHYFSGDELDSVMNYPLKDALINYISSGDSNVLRNVIFMIQDHYPKKIQENLMNIIGTHDTQRIMTIIKNIYNDENICLKVLKIITLLQFSLMGVPCIFYGDEQGVLGNDAPFCRVCMPWNNKNKKIENWYKFLGNLRKRKNFPNGNISIKESNGGLFVFEKSNNKTKFLIITNVDNCKKEYLLDDSFFDIETNKKLYGKININPYSCYILEKNCN